MIQTTTQPFPSSSQIPRFSSKSLPKTRLLSNQVPSKSHLSPGPAGVIAHRKEPCCRLACATHKSYAWVISPATFRELHPARGCMVIAAAGFGEMLISTDREGEAFAWASLCQRLKTERAFLLLTGVAIHSHLFLSDSRHFAIQRSCFGFRIRAFFSTSFLVSAHPMQPSSTCIEPA